MADPGREIRQQWFGQGFLHEDAGGVQAFAGIALAVDHADPLAGAGEFAGAGEAGEARADHDDVEFSVMHARFVARRTKRASGPNAGRR